MKTRLLLSVLLALTPMSMEDASQFQSSPLTHIDVNSQGHTIETVAQSHTRYTEYQTEPFTSFPVVSFDNADPAAAAEFSEVSPLASIVSWNQGLVGRCAHSDEPEVFIQLYGTCLPGKDAPATQEPALAAPRTVTLTRTQVSRLLAKGSGITRQPPSARARLDMPVIAYTNPATQTLTTTILDTPITITATPVSYTWDWGDNTTTNTTNPGAPYPDHTVFHYYDQPAKNLQITLTTTWKATFTTPGQDPKPVQGTITTTNTTTPFEARAYTAVLTNQAEKTQNH